MESASGNTVTLWTASTAQALGLASAAHLNKEELAQSRRFTLEDDRDWFVGARALLRHALSQISDDVAPGGWRYIAGPHGKPMMAPGLPPLEFNLSHAGDCIAVGVSTSGPVGVDIETAVRDERLEIVTSALSKRENAHLSSQPRDRQWEMFLKYWTLKEACAKALGLGAMLDFSDLEVELNPPHIAASKDLLKPGEVFDIETSEIIPDQTPARFSVAAIRNAGEVTEFRHIPFRETFGRRPL